jgi:8-amino-7-oxononanoate synthase
MLPGSFFGPPNLIELLRHRADHQALDTAFAFLADGENESERVTYRDLERRARAVGAHLQSMGLEGERALLLFPSGPEFVAAFFGCLYAGVVAVPAYPPRRNRNIMRVEAIARDALPKVALTTQTELDRVKAMLDEDSFLRSFPWEAVESIGNDAADTWKKPNVHADTLAFLQYTSGSTGVPKGVMLSHGNLMHNSAMIAYAFEHTRSGHGVFWLPLYHDMGLIGGILQPLYMGRPNTLFPPAAFLQKPLRWLQAISRVGATISGGPNSAYDLCVKRISDEDKQHLDLSSWTVAFNGAEPIRPETLDRFCEAFAECGFRRESFYPCYGLAEATLIVSGGLKNALPVVRSYDVEAIEKHRVVETLPDEDGSRELVGSGGNLLDQEIVIVDPETRTRCVKNQIGEIWVAGPSIAQGYWGRADLSEETFGAQIGSDHEGNPPRHQGDLGVESGESRVEGKESLSGSGSSTLSPPLRRRYLRTGDLGFLMDGELFVTGRLKDMIILRGVNHYPQDIEFTVEEAHPDLRSSAGAAFAVEGDGDERLIIVHEVTRRGTSDFDEIFAAIRRAVAIEHEVAIHQIALIRMGSLPKTSSGKIQRSACREAFLKGELPVIALWPPVESAASPQDADSLEAARIPTATAGRNGKVSPYVSPAAARPWRAEGHREAPAATRLGTPSDRKPERVAAAAAPQSTIEAIYDVVRSVARERAAELTPETNILELGLDSLERLEIINALEDRFGGRFPIEVLPDLETCRQVVDAVQKYLGGKSREATERPAEYHAPEECYTFRKFPEYRQLQENLHLAKAAGVANPYFQVHEGITNDRTQIGGREYTNFCSYNYLGMSGDLRVTQAAQAAIAQFGTSVSASRLVSGEKPLHRQLEQAIADLLGTEDAIVFVGGHATNETTIGHLLGPGDLILHDSLAHNSILQGSILSGARRRQFPHNDHLALAEMLQELRHEYRRVLIAVEGVYSMDGDFPNMPKFVELKKLYGALLMVDEAHSMGTMGLHGRGIGEHFGLLPRDVDIWMGTLSKSFGSCGGYISGNRELIEYLKYTAPGFVYSVGLPPPNTAAALASIRLLEEQPERVARLAENGALFLSLAQAAGLNTGSSGGTPVIPVITGNSQTALKLSQRLFQRGINVQPILYPAVEDAAARLRFFITCTHTADQIRQAVAATAEELRKIDPTRLAPPRSQPVSQPHFARQTAHRTG